MTCWWAGSAPEPLYPVQPGGRPMTRSEVVALGVLTLALVGGWVVWRVARRKPLRS